MMKGIRGLLEKDFRLFFRQGGNLFLVLVFVALFFILTGKTGAAFIAMYIPSVLAIYSGNTISYDENGHGYTYLFSLPVNKKYMSEKNIFFLYHDSMWMVHWNDLCRNYGTHKS
ncbi:MAG: ABC-2 transporter permease [Blautia massiliensis (ex Durand et al. 2017)]|uniref:ABC-2 transporter permease n=1 Tax=Blautia massiliensis (ex Durand et al. 2017) TaxID=1737424 RepID=UPI00399CBB6B